MREATGSLEEGLSREGGGESFGVGVAVASLTWYTARGGGRRAMGVEGGVLVSRCDSLRLTVAEDLPEGSGDAARPPGAGDGPRPREG